MTVVPLNHRDRRADEGGEYLDTPAIEQPIRRIGMPESVSGGWGSDTKLPCIPAEIDPHRFLVPLGGPAAPEYRPRWVFRNVGLHHLRQVIIQENHPVLSRPPGILPGIVIRPRLSGVDD